MNFTTPFGLGLNFLRHSIIATHKDPVSWVKPWWRLWKMTARAVTCASCTVPLRPFSPSNSTLQAVNMPSAPSWCLNNGVSGASRVLVPAQPMLCMRSECHPMHRFLRWFFIRKARKQKPSFVGRNARRAGLDVSSNQRNVFLYTQYAPTQ